MTKRIVVLATHDFGGAGESAFRISCALQILGHEVVMLVKQKTKANRFITQIQYKPLPVKPLLGRIFYKVYNKVYGKIKHLFQKESNIPELKTNSDFCFFNPDESIGLNDITDLTDAISFKPDLILAFWVSGFVNTRNMHDLSHAISAPLYWLTTDMAPMTGGCHYAWDCLGYTRGCENCPAILTEEFKQKASQNLAIKSYFINAGGIRVLAHSEWCRRQAEISSLFKKQKNIPLLNGFIDKVIFNNSCREIAKQIFGINSNNKVIFAGATFTNEKRKGIQYLVSALQLLYNRLTYQERLNTKIMIAGNNVMDNELVMQVPFSIVPVDFIKDERLLSLAYQASDLFVCPSIEDSGPAMVNEALACGTPVVGFDIGFVSDIVEHGVNGFRVPIKNTVLMAEYIYKIISLSQIEAYQFSQNAIQVIDEQVSLQNLKEVIENLE